MTSIRRAEPDDAPAMVEIINAIILTGDTTAHQNQLTRELMLSHYICSKNIISCMVAEIAEDIVGFQTLEFSDPNWEGPTQVPDNWGIIATFAKQGMTGAGIGSALFQKTRQAAKDAKLVAIDATIRADNTGGLKFYTKMGFVGYQVLRNVPLSDGVMVDRIRKCFDLN